MSEAPRIELDSGRSGAPPEREDAAREQGASRQAPDPGEVEKFMRKLDGTDPGGSTGARSQEASLPAGQPGAFPAPGDLGAALKGLADEMLGDAHAAGDEAGADAGRESPNDGQSQATPTPFDLFRPGAMMSSAPAMDNAPAAGSSDSADARLEAVARAVERMTVSDGSMGGEREVRIELRSDVLPGAELRIAERAGELQVEFVVTDPKSEAWLSAQSEAMASHLAERLRRDVRVRVRAPDADANTAQGDIARRPGEPAALPGPAGAGPAGPGSAADLFGDRT